MIRSSRSTALPLLDARPRGSLLTQRGEIARIVAHESAETLVGRARGVRVELVRRLLGPLARGVAGRVVAYDRAIGAAGLRDGAARIVADETGGLEVVGRERVPARGPLLVVANHPGLADAASLLAALGRDDAWIVVAEYPFLRALRLASRRFLFVPDRCAARLAAFRVVVSRLRDGEAVLVFPAGRLEVDPALSRDDALASLGTWSRSSGLFARLARDTLVLPAVVRGAVSRSAFDHPLARRRPAPGERQRMASLLQLALPAYRGGRVRVSFGSPIAASGARDVHAAALEAVRALMAGA